MRPSLVSAVKLGAVSPKRSAMVLSRFYPRKREGENISGCRPQQGKTKTREKVTVLQGAFHEHFLFVYGDWKYWKLWKSLGFLRLLIGNFLFLATSFHLGFDLFLKFQEPFGRGMRKFRQSKSGIDVVTLEKLLFARGELSRSDDARGFAEVGRGGSDFPGREMFREEDVEIELGVFTFEIFYGYTPSARIVLDSVINEVGIVGRELLHPFKIGVVGAFVFVAVFCVVQETFLSALE
jgi:hypothetical protein